jgi:hypothetical protein
MPDNDGLYSTATIAKLFMVTERWVQELTKQKILPQVKRGMYDPVPTIQAYIRYLNTMAHSSSAPPGEEGEAMLLRKLRAEVEEREARARKTKYQADVMEGKLLRLDEVSRQWSGRYVELKAAMLEFPRRAAFRFTDPDIQILVEEEAHAFVVELLERYSRGGLVPAGNHSGNSAVGAGDTTAGADPATIHDGQRMGERKQNSGQ